MFKRLYIFVFFFAGLSLSAFAEGKTSEDNIPAALKSAAITEKLGENVSIHDLHFRDEAGQAVTLDKYFTGKKPVILTLVYFGCPNLCTYLLNGTANSLRTLSWTAGEEFEIVTLSIDPTEKADLAKSKKAAYLKMYGRIEADKGWHFLTGDKDQIEKLASQIGFGYYYDEKSKEYAHSSGIFVLTPQGKISRVLYGIDFPNRDLKLALLEASDGKIGSTIDRFLMFCYKYDPNSKGYSFYAMRAMQAGAALAVFSLAGFIFLLFRRERKRAK